MDNKTKFIVITLVGVMLVASSLYLSPKEELKKTITVGYCDSPIYSVDYSGSEVKLIEVEPANCYEVRN